MVNLVEKFKVKGAGGTYYRWRLSSSARKNGVVLTPSQVHWAQSWANEATAEVRKNREIAAVGSLLKSLNISKRVARQREVRGVVKELRHMVRKKFKLVKGVRSRRSNRRGSGFDEFECQMDKSPPCRLIGDIDVVDGEIDDFLTNLRGLDLDLSKEAMPSWYDGPLFEDSSVLAENEFYKSESDPWESYTSFFVEGQSSTKQKNFLERMVDSTVDNLIGSVSSRLKKEAMQTLKELVKPSHLKKMVTNLISFGALMIVVNDSGASTAAKVSCSVAFLSQIGLSMLPDRFLDVSSYFAQSNTSDSDEDMVNDKAAEAGISILSRLLNFDFPKNRKVLGVFRDVVKTAGLVKSASEIGAWAVKTMVSIAEFSVSLWYGTPWGFAADVYPEIKDLHSQLLLAFQAWELNKDEDSLRKTGMVLERWDALRGKYADALAEEKRHSPLMGQLGAIDREYLRIRIAYVAAASVKRERMAPVGVAFFGPSHVGKTTGTEVILQILCQLLGYNYEKDVTCYRVPQDSNEKFDTTLSNLTIAALFDDFCKYSEASENAFMSMKWLNWSNDLRITSNQAQLERKGQITVQTIVNFMTTNVNLSPQDSLSGEVKWNSGLNGADAISSRIDLPYTVKKASWTEVFLNWKLIMDKEEEWWQLLDFWARLGLKEAREALENAGKPVPDVFARSLPFVERKEIDPDLKIYARAFVPVKNEFKDVGVPTFLLPAGRTFFTVWEVAKHIKTVHDYRVSNSVSALNPERKRMESPENYMKMIQEKGLQGRRGPADIRFVGPLPIDHAIDAVDPNNNSIRVYPGPVASGWYRTDDGIACATPVLDSEDMFYYAVKQDTGLRRWKNQVTKHFEETKTVLKGLSAEMSKISMDDLYENAKDWYEKQSVSVKVFMGVCGIISAGVVGFGLVSFAKKMWSLLGFDSEQLSVQAMYDADRIRSAPRRIKVNQPALSKAQITVGDSGPKEAQGSEDASSSIRLLRPCLLALWLRSQTEARFIGWAWRVTAEGLSFNAHYKTTILEWLSDHPDYRLYVYGLENNRAWRVEIPISDLVAAHPPKIEEYLYTDNITMSIPKLRSPYSGYELPKSILSKFWSEEQLKRFTWRLNDCYMVKPVCHPTNSLPEKAYSWDLVIIAAPFVAMSEPRYGVTTDRTGTQNSYWRPLEDVEGTKLFEGFIHPLASVTWRVKTRPGDCGSLYLDSSHKILGMHTAGNISATEGCSSVLFREVLKLSLPLEGQELRSQGVLLERVPVDRNVLSEGELAIMDVLEDNPDVMDVISLDNKHKIGISNKTDLVATSLEKNITPIVHKIPSQLTKASNGTWPMANGLKKLKKENLCVPTLKNSGIDVDEIWKLIMLRLPAGSLPIRELTLEDAVFGVAGVLPSMNFQTSSGPPFNTKSVNVPPGKHWIGDVETRTISPFFKSLVIQRLKQMVSAQDLFDERRETELTGEWNAEVEEAEETLFLEQYERLAADFSDHLKRELRSEEKVAAGKTRIISTVNVVDLVIQKMVLGPLYCAIIENPDVLGFALGIDPGSSDWKRLRDQLKRFMHYVHLDFNAYDGHHSHGAIMSCGRGSEFWYDRFNDPSRGKTFKELTGIAHDPQVLFTKVLRAIFASIACSRHWVGGLCYLIWGSIPTGWYGTALVNTLLQVFLHVSCWALTGHQVSAFWDHVVLWMLGDDMVASIDQESFASFDGIMWSRALLELGYATVDATKDGPVKKEVAFEELLFLKRHFVESEDQIGVLAPLDFHSILQRLGWRKKDTPDDKAHFDQVLPEIWRELWHHGRPVFTEWRDRLVNWLQDAGYVLSSVPSYSDFQDDHSLVVPILN